MELSVEKIEGIDFLRLYENVTFSNINEFKKMMEKLLEACSTALVLDMEKVSFINSTGIGIIAAAYSTLNKKQAKLVILRPKPEVARVLQIIGFDSVIPISHDEQKALDICLR